MRPGFSSSRRPSQRETIKASWSAPIVGIGTTAQFTWVTLQGVGNLVGGLVHGLVLQLSPNSLVRQKASSELNTVSSSVAGPVGIIGTIFPAAEQAGLIQLIFLTAIISLSLAVMNVLPIISPLPAGNSRSMYNGSKRSRDGSCVLTPGRRRAL